MHPAYSVIIFTTASGAGYGLLFLLGLAGPAGLTAPSSLFYPVSLVLALGLICTGLLSSTFHLGRPERAWRAFSQWRSSWLSREGVAAVISFVPAVLMLGLALLDRAETALFVACGLAAALMSVVTVYCTAMIYASLRTIRNWCNPWVAPAYLSLALATGSLLLLVLLAAFGADVRNACILAGASLLVALVVKLCYWRNIDRTGERHTMGDATGLGALGPVRQIAPPHTSDNYVMKEMGYRVARKHGRRLRIIVVLSGFVAPVVLVLVAALAPPAIAAIAACAAVAGCAIGVLVERWLFFAEARHVVTLYYGEAAA